MHTGIASCPNGRRPRVAREQQLAAAAPPRLRAGVRDALAAARGVGAAQRVGAALWRRGDLRGCAPRWLRWGPCNAQPPLWRCGFPACGTESLHFWGRLLAVSLRSGHDKAAAARRTSHLFVGVGWCG